ncbi:MAG: biotin--[acetyl-CoA-carboxylase] ligase [Clostridia bacterium]|jgi:BirA family biotin operon repressor/biotin-[acetyl-CoA-carboxylase] ligase|nr:biotin--[acetyl-CoA-carboxylase] ligase [Clostridia bacterium]
MTLKQQILQVLENNRGLAMSGQQLADTLNVTRASVWKSIKALQDEGYKIVATTNRGYVLEETNDILSEQSLRACLGEEYRDVDIFTFKTSPSTNAEAMTRLMNGGLTHGTLIVADEQTKGRGRMGKSFFSPKSGIYMSVCLCKSIERMQDVMVITPAAAVAVRSAIAKLTGIDAKIKWVNDIYIDKKKVCGILTQADIDFESGKAGTFIVGIGINFVEQDFPDEIKQRACALFTGQPTITRSRLIGEIYRNLIKLTDDLTDRRFMLSYKQHSLVMNREISYTYNGEDKSGKVIDIDGDGGLVVQENGGGIRNLTCGEISIRSSANEWI